MTFSFSLFGAFWGVFGGVALFVPILVEGEVEPKS